MAAVAEVVEQGRAAVTHDDADPEHPWTDLPDGFDDPALINDAFDDAPIVGPFLPPDAPWPFWPAAWGEPPRALADDRPRRRRLRTRHRPAHPPRRRTHARRIQLQSSQSARAGPRSPSPKPVDA